MDTLVLLYFAYRHPFKERRDLQDEQDFETNPANPVQTLFTTNSKTVVDRIYRMNRIKKPILPILSKTPPPPQNALCRD